MKRPRTEPWAGPSGQGTARPGPSDAARLDRDLMMKYRPHLPGRLPFRAQQQLPLLGTERGEQDGGPWPIEQPGIWSPRTGFRTAAELLQTIQPDHQRVVAAERRAAWPACSPTAVRGRPAVRRRNQYGHVQPQGGAARPAFIDPASTISRPGRSAAASRSSFPRERAHRAHRARRCRCSPMRTASRRACTDPVRPGAAAGREPAHRRARPAAVSRYWHTSAGGSQSAVATTAKRSTGRIVIVGDSAGGLRSASQWVQKVTHLFVVR